jgi:60 kDa SS-A/Ro ribonucleoprotein
MANKSIFGSAKAKVNEVIASVVNAAGGLAYSKDSEEALAQLACTGTFNGTYYASGTDTLDQVIAHANKVSPEFLANLCVYTRESAHMKDSAAVLLAILMNKDIALFKRVFGFVINNGKMLRTFCQVVRSGKVGRKSFGTAPKRMIKEWLENRSDKQLFDDSVGNEPSLQDIIKMVHPKPTTKNREAFYAYLLDKAHDASLLPKEVKEFEEFKKGTPGERMVPNVSFQMLTSLNLTDSEWTEIARNAKWHMTRMNLNTFERHGVLKNPEMVKMIANRLASEEDVKRAKVFPYQLLSAYLAATTVPTEIRNALEKAMEYATENVPSFKGKVFVGVDCSGSMSAPVTGNRGSATTTISCNQVAALMAASVLRKAENCEVYRFDTRAEKLNLNPKDSIMTNTRIIGTNGGGTDCGATLKVLNQNKALGDVVIILSDNESWSNPYGGSHTNLMAEWKVFKKRNPNAKLVCVDLAANTTSQAPTSKDILNIAGFADTVFEVVSNFLEFSEMRWRDQVMAMGITSTASSTGTAVSAATLNE